MKRVTVQQHREQELCAPPLLTCSAPCSWPSSLRGTRSSQWDLWTWWMFPSRSPGTTKHSQAGAVEHTLGSASVGFRSQDGGFHFALSEVKRRTPGDISVNLRLEPKPCRRAVSDFKWKLKAITLKSSYRALQKIEGGNEWEEKVAVLLSKIWFFLWISLTMHKNE